MATVKMELEPWQTPNFVRFKMAPRPRQEGLSETPGLPLEQVEASVLAAQCDAFRAEIFRKAGKPDPASRRGEEPPV